MVYFYFLDILTSFSFIAESTESDIEELRYDCYISRTMGYTIFCSYLFLFYFFSARMKQMMICIEKTKTKNNTCTILLEQLHCNLSFSVGFYHFCFRFSRLLEGGTSVNQPIRLDTVV